MNKLAWKKIGETYFLGTQQEELVRLHYQPVDETVFWMSNEFYHVNRMGLWNPRYSVYKNNVEIASIFHRFWGSKGIIKFLNGTQYTIEYDYKNTLILRFLENDSEILHYRVGVIEGELKATFNLGVALMDVEIVLLLVTLGMIMFLNIFNEFHDEGYDARLLSIITAGLL